MANNNMGVASINRRMTAFDKAPQKQAFIKVVVIVPDSPSFTPQTVKPADWDRNWTDYFYKSGDDYLNVTGNTAPTWVKNKYYTRSENTVFNSPKTGSFPAEQTLTVTNPLGSQEMADNIRTALGGWKYQPYTADGSLVTPLAELGDGINMYGTEPLYSGIYKQNTRYSTLCAADVAAPSVEEVDHEYPYVDAATKETDRRFSVLEKSVTSNYSELKQTASSISASVTTVSNEAAKKLNKTESSTSMSWNLTSSGFFINNASTANASNFKLKVNSAGAEINGTVRATAGYIGGATSGWLIGNKKISTGTAGASGSIHLDAGGATAATIAGTSLTNLAICAGANFGVTRTGKLYASGAEISGKLTATSGNIAGWDINANYLSKETQSGLYRSALYAPGTASENSYAFAIQSRAKTTDSWTNIFLVTYGGKVTASDLALRGGEIYLKKTDGTTAFRVTRDGVVTARDMHLTGQLTVGSREISADNLRIGAESGFDWSNTYVPSYGGTAASYSIGGAGGGYAFSAATTWGTSNFPAYFRVGQLDVFGLNVDGTASIPGLGSDSATVVTGISVSTEWDTRLSKYIVTGVSASTATLKYATYSSGGSPA